MLGVEHDAGPADAVEIGDAARQLLAHDLLDADIERELDGMAPAGQHVVEGTLDAGEPLSSTIGEADHMADERAHGIDALFLGLEIEAGNAEPVDRRTAGAASGCAAARRSSCRR